MKDYTMFTQTDGVYSYTFECERKEDCLVCGKLRKVIEIAKTEKLAQLIEKLKEGDFQMNQPTLSAVINGATKTLYLEKIERTHDNLKKSLGESVSRFSSRSFGKNQA